MILHHHSRFFPRSSERERYPFSSFALAPFPDPSQVLLYLEGLRESKSIDSPSLSSFPNIPLRPSSKLSALDNNHDFDDINSNVQDGRKTELSFAGRSGVVSIPSSYFPSFGLPAQCSTTVSIA